MQFAAGLLLASHATFATAATDPYGGVSLSGVYSSETSQSEDEELDGSALIARAYAGLRLDPRGNSTRFQVASSYFGYFDREDRWSNAVEAEQLIKVGTDLSFSLEGTAATNIQTLERRSADQAGISGRMRFEPGNHRLTVGAGTRRRWYDDSNSRAWAPFVELGYRYRLGSWHSIELDAQAERVNSDLDTLDYKRLALSAFYTRPLRRGTRVRLGLTHRRWTWDERLTLAGEKRRERLWLPQLRLTHELSSDLDVELDYRRVIRRSNDDRFDREGNRIGATIRKTF